MEPLRLLVARDFLEIAEIQLSPELADFIDLETPFKTQEKSLAAPELARLYRHADVPVHRFAFKELAAFHAGGSTLSA